MTLSNLITQNTEIITLCFSGIVTISTLMYAILTCRLTSETKKMREFQTEPKVSVYLQTCHVGIGFFDLVIKNIGLGPAYNVSFKVLEEFDVKDDRKLSDIEFIHEGIKYMPPNYDIKTFFLSIMGERYKEIIDKNIKIKVHYKNSTGKKITEIINLNMSQFRGIQRLGQEPIYEISKNIGKIQRNIEKLSSSFQHFKQ